MLKLQGTPQWDRLIARFPRQLIDAAKKADLQTANEIADAMRERVPVDIGDLRDSIAVTGPGMTTPPYSQPGGSSLVPENTVRLTAGGDKARQAHMIEYGTANMEAQPFFHIIVRLFARRRVTRLKRAVGKAKKALTT